MKRSMSASAAWTILSVALVTTALSALASRYAASQAQIAFASSCLPAGTAAPDGSAWEYLRRGPVLGRLETPKRALYLVRYPLAPAPLSAVSTLDASGTALSARVLGEASGNPYRERLAEVIGLTGKGGNRGVSELDGSIAPLVQWTEEALSAMENDRMETEDE